jgi:hypothetical protein
LFLGIDSEIYLMGVIYFFSFSIINNICLRPNNFFLP